MDENGSLVPPFAAHVAGLDYPVRPLGLLGEVAEYAIRMAGGSMQVRNPAPEIERIYPLAQWIEHETRGAGKVYRRRVVVVSDWEEVTEP